MINKALSDEVNIRINELEDTLEQPVTESNYRELISMQSEYDSLIEERPIIDLPRTGHPLLGLGLGFSFLGFIRNQKYRQPSI